MARFFQNTCKMITRKVLFILAIAMSTIAIAQKPQRIGYIDMEYILENVPEYTDAQSRLNAKVATWQQKLEGIKREIEIMKTDLSNEKPLLTKELINEREEDIQIKEEDLRKLQAAYFGPKGDLYLLRKQLVKPVQDQIYNAVQTIAVRKKYDIVLDKSSDLIMLYANKRFDVSELVLNSIVKGRKQKQLKEKKNKRSVDTERATENAQKKLDAKTKNREALKARLKRQQEAKEKIRAERKKAAEEKRKKRLEAIENRSKKSSQSKKNKTNDKQHTAEESVNTETAKNTSVKSVKDSIKNSKRAALLARLKRQKEAKDKLKKTQKKAAEEKRKKRLEELEKRKEAKKKEKENNN